MTSHRPSALRSLLLLVAALLCALTVAAATPQRAEAGVQADFVGITVDEMFATRGLGLTRLLDAQQQLGVGLLRQTFSWSTIETSPGRYYLEQYDEMVLEGAKRGITYLPVLIDPPEFRSSAPSRGALRGFYAPKRAADMGEFAAKLVERYGPNGTLWAENPDVTPLPIRSWQVWNEPNLPVYWRNGTGARGYVALLKAVAAGIRSADPGAEVVTAGMPDSRIRGSVRLLRYIQQMYRAKARGHFDVLAINPYDRTYRHVLAKIKGVRRQMNRSRDRFTEIWVTEYGWASQGPRSPMRVGMRGQARQVKAALLALARQRANLGLRGAVLYNWRDGHRPDANWWGLHAGLLRRNGNRKPAYNSFRSAVRTVRR
jgi:hypothetical protein